MNKTERNVKIANIKALAIILVVIGHSIILYTKWSVMDTTRSIPYIEVVRRYINILEMPLFMSASGYLFYYSIKKETTYVKFLLNKMRRLLIPFYCVGILWVAPTRMAVHIKGWKGSFFKNIYNNIILQKSVGHLWYLWALFLIIVILYPILKKINNSKDKLLFELLLLGGCLVVSMMAKSKLLIDFDIESIQRGIMYFFWFLLGYLLNEHFETSVLKSTTVPGVCSAIAFCIFFLLSSLDADTIYYYGAAFFGVMSYYLLVPNKKNKILSFIERNSFGIYLFHSPMIYITFTYFRESNPYMVVLLNVFVLGAISVLLTEGLRRTPLAFIVGE